MGKKATGDHTPEQPPLDDDAQWILLLDAVERLVKLIDTGCAPPHSRRRGGNPPTMSEDVTTGEREPHPDFWKTNSIYYEETDRSYVSVVPGSRDKLGWNIWASDPRDEDGGHVYFFRDPILSSLASRRAGRRWQPRRLETSH